LHQIFNTTPFYKPELASAKLGMSRKKTEANISYRSAALDLDPRHSW
jgi:hypothetical protein